MSALVAGGLDFDHPGWLLLLWLLLPLAWLLVRAERRRRGAALAFARAPMAARLLPPLGGPRPWLRGGALLAALACFVAAAAGPRYGVTFEPVSERGADLLVLLDVSKSMLSEDVAPNRLGRAKSDVQDLVARVVGHRLGIVAFAGKAVVACPLTTDRGFFLQALAQVDPRSAPRGGTAIGDAIRVALQAMAPQHDRDQALLLITDGEDQDSYPLEAAQAAAERGVKIFTVGLGDPSEGARVPLRGEDGGRTYLKHDGQEVWSKMQEGLLTELATKTGGAYVPARTTAYDLGEIYEKHLADLATGEIRMEKRQRHTPRFQLFLAFGLACALLERLVGPARSRAPAFATLLLLALPATGRAAPGGDAPAEVRAALALLKEGKADEALARLDAAAAADPKSAAIVFDRAIAKDAKGDFDGARADFLTAAASSDGAIAGKAQFNLGSLAAKRAELALGEQPEAAEPAARTQATQYVEEAIRHFRACLDAAATPPVDVPEDVLEQEPARKNLETLRVWLKHMEEAWARHDREQARAKMDVLQFLDWLHGEEGSVRGAARALAREADSPLRRTAVAALARRQRDLVDELPFLKDKLAQALQPPPAGAPNPGGASTPGVPPPPVPPPTIPPEQLEKMVQALMQVVDGAGATMRAAAGDLDAARFGSKDGADGHGKEAQTAFDALWLLLGGFEQIVPRGVQLAQGAVDGTQPFVAGTPQLPKFSEDVDAALQIGELDERVATLAQILEQKARAQQQQQQQQDQPPQPPAPPPPPPPDPQGSEAAPQPPDLGPALAKAVENGPLIVDHATAAKAAVDADDAATAQPHHDEALRLLKEIADLLPKSEQQDQKDQKNQEQDKKDQEKQDEKKDPKDGDSPPKQQDEPKDGQDGEPKPKPGELTKEQAEALLRKAVERARQKAEETKEAREAVVVPGRVDRDW